MEHKLKEYELRSKAKYTGRLKFITMMYYEICKLECEQGIEDPEVQGIYDKLVGLREGSGKAYWCLITLRPRDEESLSHFILVINKIVEKKWLKDKCLWVYEQKGRTNELLGTGKHVHILFKLMGVKHGSKQKSKLQCLKEVTDTCHSFKLNIEDNCIDIKTGPKVDLHSANNYLTGDKADAGKHAAQEMDKVFREKNGLKERYGLTEVI